MTEEDGRNLWRFRSKRLGIYQISLANGVWHAARYHENSAPLTANTAEELGQKIQSDHDALTAAGQP